MLSPDQILERNKLIGENGKRTREKRKTQTCKTFRFKIDCDRLNEHQKECLKMMFVEAKWIYNYIISQEDIKSIDYKYSNTIFRIKCKTRIDRPGIESNKRIVCT